MSQAEKLLERMTRNPRDGWRIEDVLSVCRAFGIDCRPPSSGSHYVVWHKSQQTPLTVPAGRPIKPVYIKLLTTYIQAVRSSATDGEPELSHRD